MHTRLRPILQDSLHRLLQPLQAGHERAHSDVQREGKRSDVADRGGLELISQCVAGT